MSNNPVAVELSEEDIEKFWSKVDKKADDECWEWLSSNCKKAYHCICIGGKICKAHRISWVIHNGAIPEYDELHRKICVCHKCDNPDCVNPKHLFLGTHKDNMRDRHRKERAVVGEAHGRSKLTNDQVQDIREKYAVRCNTKKELAKLYNVTVKTIEGIVFNKTWRHLLDEWEK